MNKRILIACVFTVFCGSIYGMNQPPETRGFLGYLKKPFIALRNLLGECEPPPRITGLMVRDAFNECTRVQLKQDAFGVKRAWISIISGVIAGWGAQKVRSLDIYSERFTFLGEWPGRLSVVIAALAGCYVAQQVVNKLTQYRRREENHAIGEVLKDVISMHAGDENSPLRKKLCRKSAGLIPGYVDLNAESVLTLQLIAQESYCAPTVIPVEPFQRIELKAAATLGQKAAMLKPLRNKLAQENLAKLMQPS